MLFLRIAVAAAGRPRALLVSSQQVLLPSRSCPVASVGHGHSRNASSVRAAANAERIISNTLSEAGCGVWTQRRVLGCARVLAYMGQAKQIHTNSLVHGSYHFYDFSQIAWTYENIRQPSGARHSGSVACPLQA